MFNFDWKDGLSIKKPAEPAAADSNASASNPSGVAANQINQAGENAERLAADSPRKRGRPRKDATNASPNSGDLQTKVDAAIAAQLDSLHDPKVWEALLCFPADTASFLTGRKHWDSSEREREVLGATGSTLARTLMITNPRALALMMFSAAMLNFYMPRAMLELKHMRAQKKEEKKSDEPKKV